MSDFKRNLVESADAAARVGVLCVAVALFAAMWESDAPPSADVSDNWLAQRAADSRPNAHVKQSALNGNQTRSNDVSINKVGLLSDVSVTSTFSVRYPMPVGITPGEYRVVDSLGNVQTVEVTSEMVTGTGTENPVDQYVIEDGDRKIYFIRIQRVADIAWSQPGLLRR